MIKLIQLLIFIFVNYFTPHILAEKVSIDEFISSYNKYENYQPFTERIIEKVAENNDIYKTSFEISPVITITLAPTLKHYLPENIPILSNTSLIESIFTVIRKIITVTPSKVLFEEINAYVYSYLCTLSQECFKETTSLIIKPALVLAQESGLFSKFKGNPFSELIPEKIKEVYTWDKLWNPALAPTTYLQCTTFVAMVYNLNNISLKGRINGDAKEWIYNTETFHVYRSGSATAAPEVLDTLVWADQGRNHVGIVVEKEGTKLRVLNSNSDKTEYLYRYHRNLIGYYTITDLEGRNSTEAWVPSHWLRIRD